jgi:hypothetical protein
MTKEDVLEAIIQLSNIALAENTLNDIMTIIRGNKYKSSFVERINNHELKARLYKEYNLVPSKPVDYLRYMVNELTGQSLLIKNDDLIQKLRWADQQRLDALLKKAPKNLAEIFFRYKPLFLAMKHASNNKRFFNQLRKLADTMHKPLPEDYLNNVTTYISNGTLNLFKLDRELQKVNAFRAIRLAHALNFRLQNPNSIVYRVRNGKGWAAEFDSKIDERMTDVALQITLSHIGSRITDTPIYIPPNIDYALPATEKQFTGNLPSGSSIKVDKNLIFGIYWEDVNHRVDLDFSVFTADNKVGWDGNLKTGSILFSGDLTSAPDGATELFYVKENYNEPLIMNINFFNMWQGASVPTKLIVGQQKVSDFNKNFMIDDILFSTEIKTDKRNVTAGLVADGRVYFSKVSLGTSVTAVYNDVAKLARQYYINSLTNILTLDDVVEVHREKPEGEFIDLSQVDKTSILGLFDEDI